MKQEDKGNVKRERSERGDKTEKGDQPPPAKRAKVNPDTAK